jgi:hypothetical protein
MKKMKRVLFIVGVFACMAMQAQAGAWSVDADKTLTEGFAGTNSTMVFTVKLSATSSVPCSVEYLTEAITAVAGEYVHTAGTIAYPAGVNTNASVSVTILGNNVLDGTRTFRLKLTNAVESTIGTASRIGTINDKTGFTLSAPSVLEGSEGTSPNLDFVLTLTTPATTERPVTVYHETSDILAVAGADYTATTGTTTFDVGQTVAHVLVPVLGNNDWQADRTLKLSILSEPRRNPIKTATGTITDDDDAPARVGLQPEETLYASIFASPTPGTSEGNPNFEGQAWYRANRTFIMKYYEEPERWGNSAEPGSYPSYLDYSFVTADTSEGAPEGSLKTTDSNAKLGVSWVYQPLYRGEYEIFFDRVYAYANGGGNPQTWKIAVYRDSAWEDLIGPQSLGGSQAAYGPGTNVVAELKTDEKIAFIVQTGGGAYNGGSCRIEGLGIRRMPLPTTVIIVK